MNKIDYKTNYKLERKAHLETMKKHRALVQAYERLMDLFDDLVYRVQSKTDRASAIERSLLDRDVL